MRSAIAILGVISFLACFILAMASVTAAPAFVDEATGQPITTALVHVEGNGTWYEYLLAPNVSMNLPPIVPGSLFLLRTGNSSTYDYYARPSGYETVIPAHPAGLVIGDVMDDRSNYIVYTDISVMCPAYADIIRTDATGRFRAVLPAENCTLSVASEQRFGSITVQVRRGETTTLTLPVAASTMAQGMELLMIIIIALAVSIAAAGIILFHRKRSRPKASSGAKAGAKERANGSGADSADAQAKGFVAQRVKSVLKEKEKLIVDELLLRGGTMSLRELRFNTQLPRTSLLRTLEGLEARGIVMKKEENGRLVVELVRS